MSSALKLAINSPETIALAFPEGIPVSSQFGGDQVMFTLTDGRKWYTAPFVANKIKEAGVTANQPFTIVKRELQTGNRRLVSYEVTAAAAAVPAAPVPANGHNGIHAVPAAPAPIDPAAALAEYFNTTPTRSSSPAPAAIAGAAAPPPAALVPVATVPPVPVAPVAETIAAAGKLAIDAVLEVEKYAQSRGMVDFNFGSENIQKVWMTLYIEASKKKGGRA